MHELLEAHYIAGDWRPRQEELTKQFGMMFEEEREFYGDLPEACGHIMRSYEYWYREEDKNFDVIAAEQEVVVPLPHGHKMGFKFDFITEDEYGRWLWEHKSHKSIPRSDYRFIDMQTARYLWGLNKIGTYGEITGIVWNYISTVPPRVPKVLKSGQLSSRKIRTDLLTMLSAIKQNRLDVRDYQDVLLRLKRHNDFFLRVRMPRPKGVVDRLVKDMVIVADEIEGGFQPVRSIDRSCEFSCAFLDLCVVELYGGQASVVRKAKYEERGPGVYYADQLTDEVES